MITLMIMTINDHTTTTITTTTTTINNKNDNLIQALSFERAF